MARQVCGERVSRRGCTMIIHHSGAWRDEATLIQLQLSSVTTDASFLIIPQTIAWCAVMLSSCTELSEVGRDLELCAQARQQSVPVDQVL